MSLFISASAWAEAAKGRVRSDGAVVYKAASFDSEVLANLAPGSIYYISDRLFNGAFYRIMVKKNVFGYVPDYQMDPLSAGSAAAVTAQKNPKMAAKKKTPSLPKQPERREPTKRSLALTRLGGLEYANIDFKEHTMGGNYHANTSFFGFKFSGPDLLIEGPFTMDINLLFSFGAPSYYADATGNSADGFIMLSDVMLQYNWGMGPNAMWYFGFGPLLRYSKFNLALGSGASKKAYLAQDMNFGADFNLGLAFRLARRWALRVEGRYYWEKNMYPGFAGAIQYSF
jgi:hypothetical protein